MTDAADDAVRPDGFAIAALGNFDEFLAQRGQGNSCAASPDESRVSFEYDQARRLTRIYDGFGNYIEYSLDTEGNVLSEKIIDMDGYLKKVLKKAFLLHK